GEAGRRRGRWGAQARGGWGAGKGVAAPAIAGTADRARRSWQDRAWMAPATKPLPPMLAATTARAPDRHAWRSAACADVAPRSLRYCRRALPALARAREPAPGLREAARTAATTDYRCSAPMLVRHRPALSPLIASGTSTSAGSNGRCGSTSDRPPPLAGWASQDSRWRRARRWHSPSTHLRAGAQRSRGRRDCVFALCSPPWRHAAMLMGTRVVADAPD